MPWLPVLMVAASIHSASNWPSIGITAIGTESPSALVSGGAIGGDGFSIGQVLEAQTGAVSFVFPWQGAPTSTLLPTQTGAGAEFGFRIAAAQFVLAVSEARRGVMPAVSSGVVKVYERAGMSWTLSFTGSSPFQPSMEHQFGHSLAIQQDTLFVGAPGYLAGRGVVYIYERTPSWTWPTYPDGSVFAYDGTSFDEFGSSMAVEGDWLAIGAPKMERDQGVAESEGAVHVFRRIDGAFVQVQRLMAPSPQGQSNFGHALAMHESVLVVGAPAEDDPTGGMDAGAVYLFALDAGRWIHQQRLVSSEAAPFDRFGSSVAVRGETVAAVAGGADNEHGANAGTVFAFERAATQWVETGRIAPAQPPIAIGPGSIAVPSWLTTFVVLRYYPTTERIFTSSFENPIP